MAVHIPRKAGVRRALTSSLLLAGAGGALAAWSGNEARPEAGPAKPVNLQVLPADILPRHIGPLMKRYEKDLGVTCSYCHVEDRDTGNIDYASDDNPKKQVARLMIGMLADINDRHLAQLGDRRYAVPVTCGSCHQGQASPPTYEGRSR